MQQTDPGPDDGEEQITTAEYAAHTHPGAAAWVRSACRRRYASSPWMARGRWEVFGIRVSNRAFGRPTVAWRGLWAAIGFQRSLTPHVTRHRLHLNASQLAREGIARTVIAMEAKLLAVLSGGVPIEVKAVCAELGMSRQTFYKYRRRFATEGPAALVERSRRPHRSPAG